MNKNWLNNGDKEKLKWFIEQFFTLFAFYVACMKHISHECGKRQSMIILIWLGKVAYTTKKRLQQQRKNIENNSIPHRAK